jgi:hypothetical protein
MLQMFYLINIDKTTSSPHKQKYFLNITVLIAFKPPASIDRESPAVRMIKMHHLQKINQSVGGTYFWGFLLHKH